jgi:hypothetical protein
VEVENGLDRLRVTQGQVGRVLETVPLYQTLTETLQVITDAVAVVPV